MTTRMTTRMTDARCDLLVNTPEWTRTPQQVVEIQEEMLRARSEEARLTKEAKAKDERIKELEEGMTALLAYAKMAREQAMGFGAWDFAPEEAAEALLAKVSP